MSKLTILRYPDPRLHKIARPVSDVNAEIRQLVDDMAQTMYAAPGIGLAATQVDRHVRVIVIDASESRNELQVFINPTIVDSQGEAEQEEGCLSVPGVFEKVRRAAQITVQALNREGKSFTLKASGTLAVCIQHEMDHLQGKVFVEYLSQLKQTRIKAKMRKLAREAA